jgi:hypothetical protein
MKSKKAIGKMKSMINQSFERRNQDKAFDWMHVNSEFVSKGIDESKMQYEDMMNI